MKKWLSKNAKWLGALGAISAILTLLMMFFPVKDKSPSTQTMVLDGNDHNATQEQDKLGGDQSLTIKGDGHTAKQKQ